MKAIIISGGAPPTKDLINQEITEQVIIIAVDSGANYLWKYNIIPHYLIGDLDSINNIVLNEFINKNVLILNYPIRKNYTDMELALQKIRDLKITNVTFLGCFGGNRIDHILANINLLNTAHQLQINATMKDDFQTINIQYKSFNAFGQPGDMFSLLPFHTSVYNLSIYGAEYPLKHYNLKIGDTRTLSNYFYDTKITITFDFGILIFFKFHYNEK